MAGFGIGNFGGAGGHFMGGAGGNYAGISRWMPNSGSNSGGGMFGGLFGSGSGGTGGGNGGIAGMLGSLMPDTDPFALAGGNAVASGPVYQPGIDTIKEYLKKYDPYMKAGTEGLNEYQEAIRNFLGKGPTGFEDAVLDKYESSPYAQYQKREATNALNKQAAAGGYFANPQEEEALQDRYHSILQGDANQYLQGALAPYEFGTQAAGQLSGLGLNATNAANQENNTLAQYLTAQQAAMARDTAGRHARQFKRIGTGASIIASLL